MDANPPIVLGMPLDDAKRVISRSGVDDQDFVLFIDHLVPDGMNNVVNERCAVEGWDEHRCFNRWIVAAVLKHGNILWRCQHWMRGCLGRNQVTVGQVMEVQGSRQNRQCLEQARSGHKPNWRSGQCRRDLAMIAFTGTILHSPTASYPALTPSKYGSWQSKKSGEGKSVGHHRHALESGIAQH